MSDGSWVCVSGVDGWEAVVAWEGRTAWEVEGRAVAVDEEEGTRGWVMSGVEGTISSDGRNWVDDAMSLCIWAVICCDTVMLLCGVALGMGPGALFLEVVGGRCGGGGGGGGGEGGGGLDLMGELGACCSEGSAKTACLKFHSSWEMMAGGR
jgi:hypothetical protein